MTPRQRLFRAVEWAYQLNGAGLVLLVFGFFVAYTCTLHGSAAIVFTVMKDDRLSADASPDEHQRWEDRHRPVREAAHRTAVAFVVGTAACVGTPVALALIVGVILLHRARALLRQGV